MKSHSLKDMLKSPDLKISNFIIEFATPGIGHILKAAGCDFSFFDMEHSGFSFETLKSAIRYFEAAGVSIIVRVPAQENDMLARACDMGAEGLDCANDFNCCASARDGRQHQVFSTW